MKKTIIFTIIAFLFTTLMAFQTFAQSSSKQRGQSAPTAQNKRDYFRSSSLIDQTVKNTHNETLGTVKDVVVSGYAGTDYLIIQPQGSNKLVPVPMDRAHVEIQRGEVIAEISPSQLHGAPSFAENQWPNFSEKSYEQKVNGYYAPTPKKGGTTGRGTRP